MLMKINLLACSVLLLVSVAIPTSKVYPRQGFGIRLEIRLGLIWSQQFRKYICLWLVFLRVNGGCKPVSWSCNENWMEKTRLTCFLNNKECPYARGFPLVLSPFLVVRLPESSSTSTHPMLMKIHIFWEIFRYFTYTLRLSAGDHGEQSKTIVAS